MVLEFSGEKKFFFRIPMLLGVVCYGESENAGLVPGKPLLGGEIGAQDGNKARLIPL